MGGTTFSLSCCYIASISYNFIQEDSPGIFVKCVFMSVVFVKVLFI